MNLVAVQMIEDKLKRRLKHWDSPPNVGLGPDSSRVLLWISVMNPGHVECPDIMSSHNNKSGCCAKLKSSLFLLVLSRCNQLSGYHYTQSGRGLIIAWTRAMLPFYSVCWLTLHKKANKHISHLLTFSINFIVPEMTFTVGSLVNQNTDRLGHKMQ